MKRLKDYTDAKQTELFEKYGVFFAFGDTQFDAQAVKGVKYCSVCYGACCPVDNAKVFIKELEDLYTAARKQYVKDEGQDNIIRYELYNHEAFYTGDIDDTVDALRPYGFVIEAIRKVYRDELRRQDQEEAENA